MPEDSGSIISIFYVIAILLRFARARAITFIVLKKMFLKDISQHTFF